MAGVPAEPKALHGASPDLRSARRQLLLDTVGIAVSVMGFGFVFGLAARNAGLSPIEASAMSLLGFAGAAQFAAIGYLGTGMPWGPILLLTALLNARHLLYSASLAPRLRAVPLLQRAAMAHVLTDEAFALAAAHFHRLGRVDVPGYWIGAVLGVFIPWNLATLAGVLLGGSIPDPSRFGLDIVFPAAMAGLAVGLITGRRELVTAAAGASIGVGVSLLAGPALGIIAGGLLGPFAGMATSDGGQRFTPDSEIAGLPLDLDEALDEIGQLADADLPDGGGPDGTARSSVPSRPEIPSRPGEAAQADQAAP